MKIKEVIEDLKIKKIKKKKNDSKIYLGLSLLVLWAVWGQFIFGQFLGPACTSQGLQASSYVVSTNDRVLICCTCHFHCGSLCFSSFCLVVSSVSDFLCDTREPWWTLFQAHFFSRAVGRERRCKQITLACARTASATLSLPPAHSACALPAHTAQALGCSAGNHLRLALGCMHLPGLSLSGSGTRVVLRGADSLGPAFCALPRSEQLR